MPYESFESLDVWKEARIFQGEITALVKTFPIDERFRLIDQLLRSSRSICTQIAEGHGRRTFPDRLKFTLYARGSLSETLNHLIDAFNNDYITFELLQEFRLKI